jgi:hypothetical protein
MRRKWIVILACGLCCVAGLALIAYWYKAESTDEAGERWTLAEFRSIRGPRDLWDFITGEGARRRLEMQRRYIAALQRAQRDLSELEPLPQAKTIALDPWTRTSPAEWTLEETELRAVLLTAELGARRHGEPAGTGSTLGLAHGVVAIAARSKLCIRAEKQ